MLSVARCPSASAAEATCQAGDRDCGKRAFNAATKDFDQGSYASALQSFLSARAAGAHAIITFNIALCWGHLGKYGQAKLELQSLLADPRNPP
ncbi:MAG: hypothetical protein QM756_04085 [Polyangiaceae bacterium]